MSQIVVLIVALCQLLAAYRYGVYAHGTKCDNFKFRIKNTLNYSVNVRIISPCNFYYDWEMDYRHEKHKDIYKTNYYAGKKSEPCVDEANNCARNGEPACNSDPYYNYFGKRARTKDQWECEVWSMSEQIDAGVLRGFNGSLPNHNLCRNPNNQSGPWCYTKENGIGAAPKWQYCFPTCGKDLDNETCFKEGYGHVQCAFNENDTCKRQGSYGGTRSWTKNSWPCQRWSVANETGQMSDNVSSSFGARIPNHNFCRNPDGASFGPWCYTADKEGPGVEYCFPTCGKKPQDEVCVVEHHTNPCVFSITGVCNEYHYKIRRNNVRLRKSMYGGNYSKVKGVKDCLPWNTTIAETRWPIHDFYFKDDIPSHNYCRDPDNSNQAMLVVGWCPHIPCNPLETENDAAVMKIAAAVMAPSGTLAT